MRVSTNTFAVVCVDLVSAHIRNWRHGDGEELVMVNPEPRAEAEQRLAEFRAKVRASGLTELLFAAAADDPELARFARAGAQLLEDFVDGLGSPARPPSRDVAADLIDGKELPGEVLSRLAPSYVVVVARQTAEQWDEPVPRPGVLRTGRPGLVVLLVPEGESALLETITGRLVGTAGWVATARRPVAELPDACDEATKVLRLAVAGCKPSGVYTMTDVLVEQAIAGNAEVTARLNEIIRPVRDNELLWRTLVALVHADFNRNQAARELFIHRSTMDYRLQRIAKITGWDPASGHGMQLLRAALFADAVA
jgi:hypothetical protein